MPALPYTSPDRQSTILGHYKTFQRSGEIAATLGAAAHLARIRWAPTLSNASLVLLKLRAGISISADVTSGKIEMALRAIIVRGFTVDFTTNMTSLNLGTTKSNAMRSITMNNSQMGASGPGICTTAALSGQTMTADAAPFCGAVMPTLLVPTSATGVATLLTQGAGTPMTTLYERGSDGDHPPVLISGEGIVVQNQLAGYASGTFALYTEWHWAEVLNFS